MSSALGADLSHVRIHDDAAAGRLARSLDARAFAVGGHVAFAPNEYAPGTVVGDALIAHELAHAVQQGGAPTAAASGGSAALEHDADLAAVGAVATLHGQGLAGLRRRAGPALRSGLQLQRCAAGQHQVQAPTAAGGIPDPVYTAAAAGGPNALDARANSILAGIRDTSRDWTERGVEAVRTIISTYFASEASKVAGVRADPDLDRGLQTQVATRPDATGTIKVSQEFVTAMSTTTNLSRYVLAVGHEILHINQHRAGMGGPRDEHEREFLAHRFVALAVEPEGTGRMNAPARVGAIDDALRHYNQMTPEQKERHRAERDELLERRRRERARARDRARIPENPPE
jgi:hypothetical protein